LKSYHIDSVDCLISAKEIRHRDLAQGVITASDWLPAGDICVGITSGASTPDRIVEEVMQRILTLAD